MGGEELDCYSCSLSSKKVLQKWQSVCQKGRNIDRTTSDSDLEEWKPPGPGFVKCNIDVAYFQEQQWWGKGMCIQDDKGWFVRATMNIRHGMPEVHEGEALVLLQTLTWLKNMDYQYVEVESDCKRLTDSLDRNIMDDSEFGMILNKCKRILMSFPNHKVSLIRKQANCIAHSLARASKLYVGPWSMIH